MASSACFFEAYCSFAATEHVRGLVDAVPPLAVLLASHNLRPVPHVLGPHGVPEPQLTGLVVQSSCCKVATRVDWARVAASSALLQDPLDPKSRPGGTIDDGLLRSLEATHLDACVWRRQGRELYFDSSRVGRFRCAGQVTMHGLGLPLGEPLAAFLARARRLKDKGIAVVSSSDGPQPEELVQRLNASSLEDIDASDVPSLLVALTGFDRIEEAHDRVLALTGSSDSAEVLALPAPPGSPLHELRCRFCGCLFPRPSDASGLMSALIAVHRPCCSWRHLFLEMVAQRLPGALSCKDAERSLRARVQQSDIVAAADFLVPPSLADAAVAVLTCSKRSTAGGLAILACPRVVSPQLLQLLPSHPAVPPEKYPPTSARASGNTFVSRGMFAEWEKYAIAESALAASTDQPPARPSADAICERLLAEGSVLWQYAQARNLLLPVKRPRDEREDVLAAVTEVLSTAVRRDGSALPAADPRGRVLDRLRAAVAKAEATDPGTMAARKTALDRFLLDVERAVEEESIARPQAAPQPIPPPPPKQPQKALPAPIVAPVAQPQKAPPGGPYPPVINPPTATGQGAQKAPPAPQGQKQSHGGAQGQGILPGGKQRGGGGVLGNVPPPQPAVLSGPPPANLAPVLGPGNSRHHHHHHHHHHQQHHQGGGGGGGGGGGLAHDHHSKHHHHHHAPVRGRGRARGGGPFGQ